jgi:phosphatidylglycerol:prolipoprotein diacylglycerol transferase
MYPILRILGFEVASYTVFTILALLSSVFGIYFYTHRKGFSAKDSFNMVFFMSVCAFLGARILNFFVNFDSYENGLVSFFEFSTRGFSLYGGVLGAIFAGLIVARIRKIELFRFADLSTPFVGIGIILMRVGCFLNGCCFGKVTSLPWGIKFPNFSNAHFHQMGKNIFSGGVVQPVHPTQIYEALFVFICVILAFFLLTRRKKFANGSVFLICGAFFSAFRWVNMYFRELEYSNFVIGFAYPLIYFVVILLCLFLFLRVNNFFKKTI